MTGFEGFSLTIRQLCGNWALTPAPDLRVDWLLCACSHFGGTTPFPPEVVPRKMIMNSSLLQALAWSVVLSLAAVGCDSSSSVDVDKCLTALSINIEVGDGAVINEVEYEITGNGIVPVEGIIDTSAPGATASVETFGLPSGDGYLVAMVATSEDGTLMCGGAAGFNVVVGAVTPVTVMLNCKDVERFGGVRVNGKLNICAELDRVIVAPLQIATGYALEVEANAGDEDDDDVEYLWTSTGGSFDDSEAEATVFVCGEADEEEITIEVSDDDFEYCVDSWTIAVNCVEDDGSGGTGIDDANLIIEQMHIANVRVESIQRSSKSII